MFVVHNGKVAVQVADKVGPRTVAVLSEGNFFGEMALFTGEPRTANVVAICSIFQQRFDPDCGDCILLDQRLEFLGRSLQCGFQPGCWYAVN